MGRRTARKRKPDTVLTTRNGSTVTNLHHAQHLAHLGYPVVPIVAGTKRPTLKQWQQHATREPDTLAQWFTGNNNGVGIATGHPHPAGGYLFVLDIDTHGADGHETLRHLETGNSELPATVTTITPTGGTHYYFTAPHPIANNAGHLGSGVDIRGTGGQVLAPPTVHPNGHPYEWEADRSPDDITPAAAPQWLLQLLAPKPAAPTPPATRSTSSAIWDTFDDSPAANYNANTTWPELLDADGWTTTDPNREQWTRPGKTTREGISATVGHNGTDALVVFTTSLTWLPPGAYSRFGYYACRHHAGDRSAAARHLRQQQQPRSIIVGDTTTAADPWSEPIPLNDTTRPPQFPIETLPAWIADHAQQIADDLQVAVDLPATLAIGALSVAALGAAKVHYPRQRWTQPLNIYAAVALPPSAGKSPAKNAMFAPLEELEQIRLRNANAARMRNDSERGVLDKRRRTLEEKAAKGGDDGKAAMFELLDTVEQIARLEHTPSGRLLADDATTEALGVALADAGGHIAVVSAEGGIFDRIAGMYNDGAANLDLYLEGWGGGRYVVDRIKREPINIPSANLVVVTTVQPAVLDEIGNSKSLTGRGLVARFLLCQPPSNVGARNRMRYTTGDEHTPRTYAAHLLDMADRLTDTKPTVTLTGAASDRFAEWDQHLENRCAPDGDLAHLAEWIGKLRASVIRIAALLHHANHHDGTTIGEQTVADAITIGGYYLEHARHIGDRWGTDPTIKLARVILEWCARTNTTEFSVRDLYSSNRRTFPTADDTRAPLELLTERGWIRPLFDGPLTVGRRGKESPRFAVHPNTTRETCTQRAQLADGDTGENPETCTQRAQLDTDDTPDTPETCTQRAQLEEVVIHASHAYTPPGGEKGAIGDVPRRGIETTIYLSETSPRPPAPCTHDTHGTQLDQTDPETDDTTGLF